MFASRSSIDVENFFFFFFNSDFIIFNFFLFFEINICHGRMVGGRGFVVLCDTRVRGGGVPPPCAREVSTVIHASRNFRKGQELTPVRNYVIKMFDRRRKVFRA